MLFAWLLLMSTTVAVAEPPTPHVSGQPDSLLFIDEGYAVRDRMPSLLKKGLDVAGWTKRSFVAWQDLAPAHLQQAKSIVIVALPRRPEATDQDIGWADMLADYVKQGGGLLLGQAASQMPANELTLYNLLARRFGTRILLEEIKSDAAQTKAVGAWGADRYTFTDRVFAPVNDGVRGVCYQSTVDWLSLYGVLPFLPDAPWRVVLSAGPNSRSVVRPIGLDVVDQEMRSRGFASDVPLAGVRDFGKGRVAYVGMAAYNVFARVLGNEEGAKTYEPT